MDIRVGGHRVVWWIGTMAREGRVMCGMCIDWRMEQVVVVFLEGGSLWVCVGTVLLSQGLPDLVDFLLSWMKGSHDGRHYTGSQLRTCELRLSVPCLKLACLSSFFGIVIKGDGDVRELSPPCCKREPRGSWSFRL